MTCTCATEGSRTCAMHAQTIGGLPDDQRIALELRAARVELREARAAGLASAAFLGEVATALGIDAQNDGWHVVKRAHDAATASAQRDQALAEVERMTAVLASYGIDPYPVSNPTSTTSTFEAGGDDAPKVCPK